MITYLTGLKSSLESFFVQRQDWMLLLSGDSHHAQAVIPVLEHMGSEWSDLEILVRNEPFEAPEAYVQALMQGIGEDWEQMRAWVRLEGGSAPEALEAVPKEKDPAVRLLCFLKHLRTSVLLTGISRLGVALLPSQVASEAEWQRFVRQLLPAPSERPLWSGSRLIVWTGGAPPAGMVKAAAGVLRSPVMQPGVWPGSLQLTLSGMNTFSQQALEQEEALAPDEDARLLMRLTRATALLSGGQVEQGFLLLESIRETAGPELGGMVGLVGGQHRLRLGQSEAAGDLFLWGLQRAGDAGNLGLVEACLEGLIRCFDALKREAQTLPLLKQLLVVCHQTGHTERLGEVLERLCRMYVARGEWEEATAAARLGLGLARECVSEDLVVGFRAVLNQAERQGAGGGPVAAGRTS